MGGEKHKGIMQPQEWPQAVRCCYSSVFDKYELAETAENSWCLFTAQQ
jgi:hypothetical protein